MHLSRDPFGEFCRYREYPFKAFCVDLKTSHFPIMDAFCVMGPGKCQNSKYCLKFAQFVFKNASKCINFPFKSP